MKTKGYRCEFCNAPATITMRWFQSPGDWLNNLIARIFAPTRHACSDHNRQLAEEVEAEIQRSRDA